MCRRADRMRMNLRVSLGGRGSLQERTLTRRVSARAGLESASRGWIPVLVGCSTTGLEVDDDDDNDEDDDEDDDED